MNTAYPGADQGLSLKALRGEFKAKGVFYTPPELAAFLAGLLPEDPANVFDPTCGHGSLLAQFPDETPKFGVDINPNAVAYCTATLAGFNGIAGDVLTTPFPSSWPVFDAIIANPPFSIKWDPSDATAAPWAKAAPCVPPPSKADWAFILLMLHHLADAGTCVTLAFPGVCYRGQREGRIREWAIRQGLIHHVIHIPGGTFEDTAIPTVALVIRKQPTEHITFTNQEHGTQTVVPVAKVLAQGGSLAVSTWAPALEPDRPPVDPVALELQARRDLVAKVAHGLAFSRAVAALEADRPDWPPLAQLHRDLRRVINRSAQQTQPGPPTIQGQLTLLQEAP